MSWLRSRELLTREVDFLKSVVRLYKTFPSHRHASVKQTLALGSTFYIRQRLDAHACFNILLILVLVRKLQCSSQPRPFSKHNLVLSHPEPAFAGRGPRKSSAEERGTRIWVQVKIVMCLNIQLTHYASERKNFYRVFQIRRIMRPDKLNVLVRLSLQIYTKGYSSSGRINCV